MCSICRKSSLETLGIFNLDVGGGPDPGLVGTKGNLCAQRGLVRYLPSISPCRRSRKKKHNVPFRANTSYWLSSSQASAILWSELPSGPRPITQTLPMCLPECPDLVSSVLKLTARERRPFSSLKPNWTPLIILIPHGRGCGRPTSVSGWSHSGPFPAEGHAPDS